nr:PREDICTED: pseudouridine-5'-phosphatase-like [Bemisia tabaci]
MCDVKMSSPNKIFKPVTHCIFDMDGLLLDSEKIYREAFSEVFARYDRIYTEEVKMKAIGKQPLDCLRTIIDLLKIHDATPEQLAEEIKELLKDRIKAAKFKPGAEKLIHHLAAHKIPMAIATSAWIEMLETLKACHAKTFSLFHHIVAGDSDPEVREGKPSPDIFLVCASRFDGAPGPTPCLVFEDAPSGVLAAKRAKMQVVMVPDSMVTQDYRDQATLVINSLEDFRPEDFGLPPH